LVTHAIPMEANQQQDLGDARAAAGGLHVQDVRRPRREVPKSR
jgi:hypothetical protein